MGTRSFPGIKWPERGADHPPPSSVEVENEYSYTSTPRLGHEACYRVKFTFLLLNIRNAYCQKLDVTGYFQRCKRNSSHKPQLFVTMNKKDSEYFHITEAKIVT
jgi:hypothetical protein